MTSSATRHKLGAVINWFPGHMVKATRDIKDRIKAADLILEVRDARVSSTRMESSIMPSNTRCFIFIYLYLSLFSSTRCRMIFRASDCACVSFTPGRSPRVHVFIHVCTFCTFPPDPSVVRQWAAGRNDSPQTPHCAPQQV